MRLQGGQKIGERYTLIERIGSGGMADVWVADDATLGRRVALKFLHESFGEDAQFVERFRREASAAAGLQHPNIVGVYDRGEFDGRHFIAMEYVEGASLKDLINRGLSVAESIEIVRQILAGARFAHEREIVHRDLKPQNVLIDAEGRARVTDFGIARAGASEITQTGSVLGTAQYLSPEQAQGLETTATSDIYSVGIILYECLTGRVPFDGESTVAVALKQVSEQPRPPSQIKPSIPHALDGVVLKALAKDPADRYGSAAEFARALAAAEADPSAGTTALQGVAAVGAGAALGAAAAATPVAASTPPPPYVEDIYEVDERSWFDRNRNKVIALAIIVLLLAAVIVYALTRESQQTVPDVKGESATAATAELKQAGFEVFTDSFESCDERNTVSEQDPLAGTMADKGETVKITVSKGLVVTVPDVVGKPQAEAIKQLQSQMLPKATQRFSSSVGPGKVISTDPPAGTKVQCKTAVDVSVSRGANIATVPDVTGLDQSDAQTQLRDAGFTAKVETEDSDEPEGTVIGEDPGPGSKLAVKSPITITVSTGAGSVVVPNVIGQPEDTAIEILKGRGAAKIKVVEQETSDASQDGNVLDQAPSSGTRIRSDEQVTIFVGKFVDTEPPTTTSSSSSSTSSTSTTSTDSSGGTGAN